jgi:hypothetical protein
MVTEHVQCSVLCVGVLLCRDQEGKCMLYQQAVLKLELMCVRKLM